MLILTCLAVVAQLIPLPYALLHVIDPQALDLRAALWLTASDTSLWLPISIVPKDTIAAVGLFVACAVFFSTCRSICEAGGPGRIVRAVAFIGLVASVAGIAQRAQNQELLYGIWRPLEAGARPFGPFVNRNHFATWVVMACPLVFGYLLARAPEKRSSVRISQRVAAALQELGSIRSWLLASVCIMTLALLISTSRSGLIALFCAFSVSTLLARHRFSPAIRRWTIAQGILLLLVAISFANFESLIDRFDQTLRQSGGDRGRTAVWADTRQLIRDFPLTGTGAGTFGTAIIGYQTAEPGYSIGNAHNHYLQLAAEGGAMIGVPAAVIVGAFFTMFLRGLRRRDDPDYLVRVGAIAGISAALVQSVWETGLRMPANAMLLALLAAIATHSPAIMARSVRLPAFAPSPLNELRRGHANARGDHASDGRQHDPETVLK
jgi:O-antigen ligase